MRAFSLLELLIVITLIALLTSLPLLSIQVVRTTALSTKCVSSLSQIGLAALAWSQDHKGSVLPQTSPDYQLWFKAIEPYLQEDDGRVDANARSNRTIIHGCPAWEHTVYRKTAYVDQANAWGLWADVGYGETLHACEGGRGGLSIWYSSAVVPRALVTLPSDRPFIADCAGSVLQASWYADDARYPPAYNRHRGQMKVLYFDAHIGTSTFENVLNWQSLHE